MNSPTAQTPKPSRTWIGRRWTRFADFLGRHGRGLTLANVFLQGAIIVTGGAVRLTASGLGCSTAPLCEPDQPLPDVTNLDATTAIEFSNRLVAVIVVAVAGFVAVAVWRTRPDLRFLGLVPLVGAAGQAILGIATVDLDLKAAVVSLHMLISTALVWLSVQLSLRYRNAPPRQGPPRRASLVVLTALTAVVVTLGAMTTGTGPHSGDDDVTERLPFDLETVTRVHALAVWAFVLLLAWIIWSVRRDRSVGPKDEVRKAWLVLLAVTLAQGAIGYAQYFTGLPALLVGFHLAGAATLVAAQSAAFYLLRSDQAARTVPVDS